MKSNLGGLTSLVLIIVASSSLISMIALTRVDNIVHTDLYRYGLNFSYEWAMPYWTMTTFAFAMGWVNIFMVIVFQFYVLVYGRIKAEEAPSQETLGSFEIARPEDTENAARETISPLIEARSVASREDSPISAGPPQAQEPILETSSSEGTRPEQFEFERDKEFAASFESLESEFRPREENAEARWTAAESTEAIREAPQEEYRGTALTEDPDTIDMRLREERLHAEEKDMKRDETPKEPFETETRAISSFEPVTEGKSKEKEKNSQSETQ